MNKKIKKMTCWDLKLVKLSTAAFVLFLLAVWPALAGWLLDVHWGWYLALTIIFAWKPCRKLCCK